MRPTFHVIAANPDNIRDMVRELKARRAMPTHDELRSLGKLMRDLTGYIKLVTGDKPDPVRDDLLLQARQLLGLTEL